MLRVWSCILGCLGFLLDGWPILPMFFVCYVLFPRIWPWRIQTWRLKPWKLGFQPEGEQLQCTPSSPRQKKRQRCPTHFAVDEQTQIAEFFQFLLTEACGKIGGTTVQRYWLVRQTGCRNAQISLCHTQPGPGKRSHVLKIRVFDQQNFDLFTGKDVFLLANTVIYPAKIAGFDDKHGRIFFCLPATIGMLHCYIILATKILGRYQQKKRWFLHSGFASFRWHRNEFYQQKSNFNQQKRRLHTQGWWMVMCFSVCHVARKVDYCNWQLKHKVMCWLLEIYEIGYVGGVLRDRNLCQTPDW